MRKSTGLVVVAIAAACAGCAKKSDLDSVQAQLEACEKDKAVATSLQSACQEQLDSERKRWDGIEQELKTALPETLRGFEEERSKLIEAVPQKVQHEVGKRFDAYIATVAKEFKAQREQLDALQSHLDEANRSLGDIKTTTSKIDSNTSGATTEERKSLQARMAARDQLVSQVVSEILDFDNKNITCAKCEGGIKLKDRSKEALAKFHAKLIDDLQKGNSRAGL